MIGNQQVEATFTDSVPLVPDFHRNLPPKLDISQSKLHAQSVLIDRLPESRPTIRWTSMAGASNSETCSSSSFAGSSRVSASLASWPFTHPVSAALPRRCGLSERHCLTGLVD